MEWWLPEARGSRKQGSISQKVQSFSYIRQISPRDLLYSIVPIGNNTVLCTKNFAMRLYLMFVLITNSNNNKTGESFQW